MTFATFGSRDFYLGVDGCPPLLLGCKICLVDYGLILLVPTSYYLLDLFAKGQANLESLSRLHSKGVLDGKEHLLVAHIFLHLRHLQHCKDIGFLDSSSYLCFYYT